MSSTATIDAGFGVEFTVEEFDFQQADKVSGDVKRAAETLGPDLVRYFVDSYYQAQQKRIRSGHQFLASNNSAEPNALIEWELKNCRMIERSYHAALGAFASAYRVGRWMQSIVGIGPVISAGMIAHVDIRGLENCGQVWSFAGLSPQTVWPKKEKVREVINRVVGEKGIPSDEQFATICREFGRTPHRIRLLMTANSRAQIIKALTRRPWNTPLKTLAAFKLGECFVKTQNHEDSFYGPFYVAAKERIIAENHDGKYAEQAKAYLQAKSYGKETSSFKCYSQGRLPPAQIHARARRMVAKLFLSHLFEVMYHDYHGHPTKTRPYALEKLSGHTKYIAPPNWPNDPETGSPWTGKRLTELYGVE